MLVVECPYSDELNRRIQVFQAFTAGRMRVCLKNLSENLFWPSLPYEIIADFLLRNPYRTEFRIRCAGPITRPSLPAQAARTAHCRVWHTTRPVPAIPGAYRAPQSRHDLPPGSHRRPELLK